MTTLSGIAWAMLCLFVFSIPWEKSVVLRSPATLSHLFGALAFAAGAAAAVARRSARLPNAALILAACLVAWSWVTWLWSVDPRATLRRAFTLAELAGMAWLIWDSVRDRVRQRRLIQAYVFGATAAAAATYVRFALGKQTYWRRYAAPGFDPNDCGLILALSVPLALYLALKSGPRVRLLYYAAVVFALGAILLTASRTALVATFVAFAFSLWTWRQADWPQRIATVLLPVVLVCGLYTLAPAPARQRLATLPTELTRGTLHNRTTIWKAGLRLLRQHPVLGIGAGAYPEAVRPTLGKPGIPDHFYVAHNTFLSILVELGAIGFGLFALMMAVLAVFVWTLPSAERALWSIMLLVWAVGVSTLTWEHYKPTWLIFALIMTEWGLPWYPRQDRK